MSRQYLLLYLSNSALWKRNMTFKFCVLSSLFNYYYILVLNQSYTPIIAFWTLSFLMIIEVSDNELK